jgi:hypothetical protein
VDKGRQEETDRHLDDAIAHGATWCSARAVRIGNRRGDGHAAVRKLAAGVELEPANDGQTGGATRGRAR